MKLPRRKFLQLAAGTAAFPAVSPFARAQGYPSRPVRIAVGFPAGGGSDITARLIGQWLSERLGQPFVVENRPGAATNIATEAVVRAPADGYTLLLFGSSSAINATFYDKLPFNLYSRYLASRWHQSRALCHRGKSIASSQVGSRVCHLRQGQSREDQHGIFGEWFCPACLRRIVQDHDGHQYGPRALSRRGHSGNNLTISTQIGRSVPIVSPSAIPARRHCGRRHH